MEDCSYLSPPRLRATAHSDKSSNQATPEYEFLVNDMGDAWPRKRHFQDIDNIHMWVCHGESFHNVRKSLDMYVDDVVGAVSPLHSQSCDSDDSKDS